MRLPFAFMKSVGAPVFDITTLSWSSLHMADYASVPWTATASAGASAVSGSLLTAGADPVTGPAQNGKIPALFQAASTQYLQNSTPSTTLFTTTAGTIVALVYIVSAVAPTGTIYGDPALYVDAGVAELGMTITTSGITGFVDSGGYVPNTVAAAPGSYHLVMMRWNGAVLGMTIDSVGEVTTPAGTIVLSAGVMHVGRGYLGGTIDARVLMRGTSTLDLSGSYSNIKSGLNSLYGLAL